MSDSDRAVGELSAQRAAAARYDLIAHLRSGVCVELPSSNEFVTTLRFGSSRDIVIKRSVSSSLIVPSVRVKSETLLPLLQRVTARRDMVTRKASSNLQRASLETAIGETLRRRSKHVRGRASKVMLMFIL
jgi:hypothetical protein